MFCKIIIFCLFSNVIHSPNFFLETGWFQKLSWHIMMAHKKWQGNRLWVQHISDFNDLERIALISVLRLIFQCMWLYVHQRGALCGSRGSQCKNRPDQLFIGYSRNGTYLCPARLCHTQKEQWRDFPHSAQIFIYFFSGFLLLPWGSLILPTD